jgi:hypothetical protein
MKTARTVNQLQLHHYMTFNQPSARHCKILRVPILYLFPTLFVPSSPPQETLGGIISQGGPAALPLHRCVPSEMLLVNNYS